LGREYALADAAGSARPRTDARDPRIVTGIVSIGRGDKIRTCDPLPLGKFPGLSLADARARAQRFRDLLQDGIDPRSAMNRPGPRAAVEAPKRLPQAIPTTWRR
jgi:hypothetical protein